MKFCQIFYKSGENLDKPSSMAKISKISYFMFWCKIVTLCKAYTSVISLCYNADIPTLHTREEKDSATLTL